MIRAKWINGQLIPEGEIDWPEGTVVYVSREPTSEADESDLAEQKDDPASIAAWLAWYDSLEPLVYAPGEEAEIEAARKERAEYSRKAMNQGISGVFE